MITLNLHVPAVPDTQPAFTCSKSVIKTPRQCVQSVNIRTTPDVLLVSLLLNLNKFHALFCCFHCLL